MPFDIGYRRIPQLGDHDYRAAVEMMTEQVVQLNKEKGNVRLPISQSAAGIMQYILDHQHEDALVNDKVLAEKNPYEEKKTCCLL